MKAILYHRKILYFSLDWVLSWANLVKVATIEGPNYATVAQLLEYAHDASADVDWREHPAPGVTVEKLTFNRAVPGVFSDDGRRGTFPCIDCGVAWNDHIAPESLCPDQSKRMTIEGDVIEIDGKYFRYLKDVWKPIPEPLPVYIDRTAEALGKGFIIGGAKPVLPAKD